MNNIESLPNKRSEIHDLAGRKDKGVAFYVLDQLLRFEDVNIRDENGWSPLHFAAFKGSNETIGFLLVFNADIDAKNENLETPLHLAAWNGMLDNVRLLIKLGADINAQDQIGQTPVKMAAHFGHVEIVKELFDAGAKKDFIDAVKFDNL